MVTHITLQGWSGGAMVLGKLPVPGRPTILITVGQGPIALAVGAGGGGLDIFTLIYPFSSFSLSLGDGSIWSQRAVKPKTTKSYHVALLISPQITVDIITRVPGLNRAIPRFTSYSNCSRVDLLYKQLQNNPTDRCQLRTNK